MKTAIVLAALVALGGVTAGLDAIDSIPDMKGSDTLTNLTRAVISGCVGIAPAGAIAYSGTGSANGQTALVASALLWVNNTVQATELPFQTIAVMSRSMNSSGSLCAVNPQYLPEAEGLVVALDGLSIVAADAALATDTCNLPVQVDSCSTDASGVRGNVTALGDASNAWQETLRILYAGARNGIASGDVATLRDCNSLARHAIVAAWNELFEGDCPSCDDPVAPNVLRHAFRREEASGTSDVFLALLGLPTIDFMQGTSLNYDRRMANSMFCNVRRSQDSVTILPGTNPLLPEGKVGYGYPVDAQPHESPDTWDDPANPGRPYPVPYFPEFQDADPIRRTCVGTGDLPLNPLSEPPLEPTEQVCGPKGTLGVVLPIGPPPQDVSGPAVYPTQYCRRGSFGFADSMRPNFNVPTWCPNGDVPLGDTCLAPTTASGDFNCIAGRNSCPTVRQCEGLPNDPPSCAGAVALKSTIQGGTCDGRVYNLHARRSDGFYQRSDRPNPAVSGDFITAQIVGAFYKIHSTRTLHSPFNTGTCRLATATDQLGCLPTASHCSIGFSSVSATSLNPAAQALRVNGVLPERRCIETVQVGPANQQYPLAHKLYLNALKGFESVGQNLWTYDTTPTFTPLVWEPKAATLNDNEIALTRCYASVLPALISSHGFTPTVGAPFCEDFNEAAFCGGTSNTNACADSPGNAPGGGALDSSYSGVPENSAYCGNGSVEFPELCDDGNATESPCNKSCTPS